MIPKTTSASASGPSLSLAPGAGARRLAALAQLVASATSSALTRPSSEPVSSTHGQLVESRLGEEYGAAGLAELALAEVAWRSRLEPSGVIESLRWHERRRSQADGSVALVDRLVETLGGPDVVARREQMARVEAHRRAARRRPRRRSAPRAPRTTARACRPPPPCPRDAARTFRSRPAPRSITLPARLIALPTSPAFAEPGCSTTPGGADRRADAQRLGQRGERLLAHLAVLGCAVDQIDRVDQHGPIGLAPRPRGTPRSHPRRTPVGRHMRGDWLKIWIASQPRSAPRSTALEQAAGV